MSNVECLKFITWFKYALCQNLKFDLLKINELIIIIYLKTELLLVIKIIVTSI